MLDSKLRSTDALSLANHQAVPELKAIGRMEQRIFQAVQPGDEIKYQPGFGNRNLFLECKNRLVAKGKVTRSNGKCCRSYPKTAAA